MTPNVALLRLTLKHIEMAPCTWDQQEWRRKAECGTVMCFAGWACTLAGGQWYRASDHVFRSFLKAEDDDERPSGMVPAESRAKRVLGLTWQQANMLFHDSNTLADLHRIVDEICAEVES